MTSINSSLPSSSDVPEVGIFRMSPAEVMRDFARSQQFDNPRDNKSFFPDLPKQHDNEPRNDLRGKTSSVGLLTNGSLQLLLIAEKPETSNTMPKIFPKCHDEELGKNLQKKNQHIDLSQYLIRDKGCLELSKYVINISDEQDDSNSKSDSEKITPTVNLDAVVDNGNKKENKLSKLQRLRRSLKEFKKRIVRPLTLFTTCFTSTARH